VPSHVKVLTFFSVPGHSQEDPKMQGLNCGKIAGADFLAAGVRSKL